MSFCRSSNLLRNSASLAFRSSSDRLRKLPRRPFVSLPICSRVSSANFFRSAFAGRSSPVLFAPYPSRAGQLAQGHEAGPQIVLMMFRRGASSATAPRDELKRKTAATIADKATVPIRNMSNSLLAFAIRSIWARDQRGRFLNLQRSDPSATIALVARRVQGVIDGLVQRLTAY